MGISVYNKPGRSTVYLVHKVINGKAYSKTFQYNENGLLQAKEFDSKLNEMSSLAQSINERKVFLNGKIRGLNLNKRINKNGSLIFFRVKIKVNGTLVTLFKPVRNREEVAQQYEESLKQLRKTIDIDSHSWCLMKKEFNKIYFLYLKQYCQLTGEIF